MMSDVFYTNCSAVLFILNLGTNCPFRRPRYKANCGRDWSTGYLYFSKAPNLTFGIFRGPYLPYP